jgi:hypothetical protein
VGLRPWLPGPLGRRRWWTGPVRAERLAALRIGLAAVLLFDVLVNYLPHARDLYGPDGLAGPAGRGWSVLGGAPDPHLIRAALALWAAAAAGLLVGAWTRAWAVLAWVLSTSFANLNPLAENAGDTVRGIVLFYLMLCPCGAAWSLDARHRRGPAAGPAWVYPWPLRLLFVQMVLIYFNNGLHKVVGRDWLTGRSLYYVLGDLTLARWSYAEWPLPYRLTQLLTWLVLGWELLFPALVLWRPLRVAALCFGAAFHVGIWACLELGNFAPYMLCLYLPLLPWERWADRRRAATVAPPRIQ